MKSPKEDVSVILSSRNFKSTVGAGDTAVAGHTCGITGRGNIVLGHAKEIFPFTMSKLILSFRIASVPISG